MAPTTTGPEILKGCQLCIWEQWNRQFTGKEIRFDKAYSACCTLGGKYGGLMPCICMPLSVVSRDRSNDNNWDPFHPCDTAKNILANRLFDGGIDDFWPINVTTMLAILTMAGFCMGTELPAVFVFGDSLLEVGNNNYIATLSRSDYVPNGIDFGRPTGRFTNNRTIFDIIGQQFGLDDFIPPYLAPTTSGPVVLKGVNYASGGAGILNHTGYIFIKTINMDGQLDNFANTRQDILSLIGASAAQELLSNAIFTVEMGQNDILNNYLVPVISVPKQIVVSPQSFISAVIKRYRLQLTRLHSLGARKFIVVNSAPLGCIPYMRDVNPAAAGAGCYEYANQIAETFNAQLKSLISDLNSDFKGSIFLYVDAYKIFSEITQNYASYGFENADSACCKLAGNHGGLIPCTPPSNVCPDRSTYFFWDPYHPTDAANVVIASYILDGGTDYVWPINVRQLLNRQMA